MPVSIWESVASTSWWVFVLYTMVIAACWQARYPSKISLNMLIFLPLYSFTLAAICAAISMNPTPWQVAATSAALGLGTALGWAQSRWLGTAIDLETRSIALKGSNLPILCLAAATLAKLTFGFSLQLDPKLLASGIYNLPLFTLFGFFTGLSIGRYCFARQALKHANA
ncbi:MAG TPA: hypothetical protein VFU82_05040 [Gammaproteobacteria bacterium]|nr:hypothetical protein [Gammaproteobacteria bacterium]